MTAHSDAAEPPSELRARLEVRAAELGFSHVGVAAVAPLGRDDASLRAWIAAGHHASMGWMRDTLEVRLNPASVRMLEGAVCVVALATPYGRVEPPGGPTPGRVARYARGRDYHNVVGKRLRKLARLVREAGHAVRGGVDALPVLERAWAQRAGLGFIGKNTCLIIPGIGSHVFLSVLVTDAPLPVDQPMGERCGSCRRCLDVCPTEAFTGVRELDARRCISYLTIEHDGPIESSLRSAMGEHLFGCDRCQDVCPFNETTPPDAATTAPFAPSPQLEIPTEELLTMSEEEHRTWARGSPLRRAGRAGLARNAAIVLGNHGDRRYLPVLQRAARAHDEPVVRDAAAWAVRVLEYGEDIA